MSSSVSPLELQFRGPGLSCFLPSSESFPMLGSQPRAPTQSPRGPRAFQEKPTLIVNPSG